MAYDQVRGISVLGGLRANYYQETWEYDGADWTQVTPTLPYPIWIDGALVEDSLRARLVFFGGMRCAKPGCGYSNETYEYTGTAWIRVFTPETPAPRTGTAMAYDTARGLTVLFGGGGNTLNYSDTWQYDGADWQLVSPAMSPPARTHHGMVYDIAHHKIVLFGGMAGRAAFDDTWEYDGTTWHLITPLQSPSPRSYPAMVYDAARALVVLYGGYKPEGGSFNDTWEYDGTTWRLITWYAAYLPYISRP